MDLGVERSDLQGNFLRLSTLDDIVETLIKKHAFDSLRYLTAYMTKQSNRILVKQYRMHSPFPPVAPGEVNWEYDPDMEGYHTHSGYLTFKIDESLALTWKYVGGMEDTDTVFVSDKNLGILAIIKNIKREE